mmetsp:Transcript_48809/g.125775  ORF Transcript_48809/g.125775 Transcript_48809/m.125775 type:complete len:628 (-) Transcript_48809:66-1949(-)
MAPRLRQPNLRFARKNGAATKVSQRIGWLNKNAGFAAEIHYSKVKDILSQVGDAAAMRVLQEVADRASEIQDPTGFVLTEAELALQDRSRPPAEGGDVDGGEPGSEGDANAAGDPPKAQRRHRAENTGGVNPRIATRVQWLNENAGLCEPVDLQEVADLLADAGPRSCMAALKDLEEKAGEVRNPTAYLHAQLTRIAAKKAEAPSGRAAGLRTGVIKTALKSKGGVAPRQGGAELRRKVEVRMEWLNTNAGLAAALDVDKLGSALAKLGSLPDSMAILKQLEENSADIRDPTGWVLVSARRALGTLKNVDKLPRRVDWLNNNLELQAPLELERIGPHLEEVGETQAMEILRTLEQHHAEVRDPNAYVIGAARRLGAGGGRRAIGGPTPPALPPPPALPQPPPAPRPRPSTRVGGPSAAGPEEKLARRIDWLNAHLDLASPLIYERVAPTLLDVGYHIALEVLNNLEESSATVRDPNGFVIAGARREGGGGGGGGGFESGGGNSFGTPPRRPPRPSSASSMASADFIVGEQEERLAKRLTWLNRNTCPDAPLDFDRLAPHLLSLPKGQAMEVLKHFEESAPDVRDPNAFVIAKARRASQEGGGGGGGGGRDRDRERRSPRRSRSRGRR